MTDSPEIAALRAAVEIQGAMLKQALELARPQTLGDRLGELRELAAILRDVTPPAPPAPAPTVGVPSDGAGRLIDRIGDLLERMVKASDATPARRPAPAPVPAAPLPDWLQPLAPAIPYVLGLAASGNTPEAAAAALASQIPKLQRKQLAPIFRRDGYPSAIINAVPAFQPHADWLTLFFYQLRANVLDNGTGAPAPAGTVAP